MGTTLMEKKTFKPEKLEKALRNVEDLFDKCLLPTRYLLLKETGKAANDNIPLFGDGIDVGIELKYLTKEVRSTLDMNLKNITGESSDGVEYEVGGVPVRVKYIKRNYKFFKRPKQVIYQYGTYQIPNPFDRYWKARFFVK